MREHYTKAQMRPLSHLFEARVYLGHRKSRVHPEVASYLYGIREGIHIIDMKRTVRCLAKALGFLVDILQSRGNILIVGNRQENAFFTHALGKGHGKRVAFVNSKWIGGCLTNRESFLTDTKQKRKTMTTFLRGFPKRFRRPHLIILLNENPSVLQEAYRLHIPVIGIVDSNVDPKWMTYPIPGNDDSTPSHFFYSQAFSYVMKKILSNTYESKT